MARAFYFSSTPGTQVNKFVVQELQDIIKDPDVYECIRLVSGGLTCSKPLKEALISALNIVLRSITTMDDTEEDTDDYPASSQGKQTQPSTSSQDTPNKRRSEEETKDDGRKAFSEEKTPQNAVDLSRIETKNKIICRFYRNGNCKRGKLCTFEHPRKCKIFCAHGLKKFNDKGCDGKCKSFHPKACYNSMKQKLCPKKECHFFHINGTKRDIPQTEKKEKKDHSQHGVPAQSEDRFLGLHLLLEKQQQAWSNQLQSMHNQMLMILKEIGLGTSRQHPNHPQLQQPGGLTWPLHH